MQRKRVRWWRGFDWAIESGADWSFTRELARRFVRWFICAVVYTDWAIAPLKNRSSTGQSTTKHPIKTATQHPINTQSALDFKHPIQPPTQRHPATDQSGIWPPFRLHSDPIQKAFQFGDAGW